MTVKNLFMFVSVFLIGREAIGQAFNFKWAEHIGGQNGLSGRSVNIDVNGNVIVGGVWEDNIDFDPPNQLNIDSSSNYSNSIFLAKYDYYGNYLWGFVLKSLGTYDLSIDDIETDIDENIYIGGYFKSNFDLDPSSDTALAIKSGITDCFLAKYDKHGNYVWSIILNSITGEIKLKDIEIDNLGNIYITGPFQHYVDFDPSQADETLYGSSSSIFIAKYSSTGSFLDVHYFYCPAPTYSYPTDMSVDQTGSVYVTGALICNNFYVNGFTYPGSDYLTGVSSSDIFLIKLNPDLNPVWYHGIGSSETEIPTAITIDSDANVYLAGYYESSIDMDPDSTTWILTTASYQMFLAKYDSTSQLIWAKDFSGGNSYGRTIDLDQYNNIYLGFGAVGTVMLNPSIDNTYFYSPTGTFALAKLNQNGIVQEHIIVEAPIAIYQGGVDVDQFGNIVLTNGFYSSIDLDPTSDSAILNSIHYSDAYSVMYSPCTLNAHEVMDDFNYSVCPGDSVFIAVDSLAYNSVYWSDGSVSFSNYYPAGTGFVVIDSLCVFYFNVNSSDTLIITQSFEISNGDSVLVGSLYYSNSGIFTDTVISSDGCVNIITTNVTITGLDKVNTSESFIVYPNPNSGLFEIMAGNKNGKSIKIYNTLGETIYESNNIEFNSVIDLSGKPNGIYVIHLTDEKSDLRQLVIINK